MYSFNLLMFFCYDIEVLDTKSKVFQGSISNLREVLCAVYSQKIKILKKAVRK